jgi:GGDEF domain-containing protein
MLLFQIEFEDLYIQHLGVTHLDQLREPFAWLVARSTRGDDTVGWLYEGCLAVILRSINAEDTSLVATRLQKILARHPLLIADRNLHLAIQVGGVWYSGLRPMKPSDFTLQALQAMGG